ncbi:hypothetical protein [Paenibacillus sp. WLX2291]|uniref:hypothetical protein n=1 Tax=Paenibacillus sp. WLX2291 TaxID=3296934 RepID=UPI0039845BCF
MYPKKKRMMTLTTDEQLYNAARSGIEVTIYIGDEEDYTGKILEYSDGAIKTADGFYLRDNCVVKTTENYLRSL